MLRNAFLAIFFFALPANASEQAGVAYYPVTGKTAQEIYQNIKTASPRVARNATFAFTAIGTKTDKREKKSENACSYSRFKTSAIYIFNLPQLRGTSGVSKATKAKWGAFVNYLKVHEEGHRSIWSKCFAEYDAEALQLQAKSCETLDKVREKTFTAVKRRCLGLDETYDFQFRKDVLREPFVIEALRLPRK